MDLISKIEDKWLHDTSAIHSIQADTSSYIVQFGNPSSKYNSSANLELPTDLNSMLINLTPNLVLKDTSDVDIECYSKVQMDTIIGDLTTEIGQIPLFDTSTTYYKNQLVKHNSAYWRCVVSQITGAWNSNAWIATSVVNELFDIRGVQTTTQKVTVNATVDKGEGSVVDVSLTLTFDSSQGKQTETRAFDSTGQLVFFIDYGYRYSISLTDVSGYKTPSTSDIYVANTAEKVINLQYKLLNTGIFVIDKQGLETDIALWDPQDNPNARYIKLTNSTLNPPGATADNSIIISKYWLQYYTSRQWQVEYKILPGMGFKSSNDYNGQWNCSTAYADCTTEDESGKTFVDLYNEAQGTSITVDGYISAIRYCMNTVEVLNDVSVYGYLPAIGQLVQLNANKDEVNAALSKIGSSQISFASYYWWSSTQYSHTYAWNLANGSPTYDIGKTNSYQVLPFFAL